MAKKKKRSVGPVYTVAAIWLLYAFFASAFHLFQLLLMGVLSVAAFYFVRALFFPTVTYDVPEPEPKPEPKPEPAKEEKKGTGNPDLDAVIFERDRAVSEMHRLNEAILDPTISDQIDHLEDDTKKIIDHVVAHPEKLPQIRRFMNYYLPTTLKLLNAYDRMDAAGVSGTNIDGTKGKIEDMMSTIVRAFDKQLDSLFGDEALDISADITVMENMLAREGIGGVQFKTDPTSGTRSAGI